MCGETPRETISRSGNVYHYASVRVVSDRTHMTTQYQHSQIVDMDADETSL